MTERNSVAKTPGIDQVPEQYRDLYYTFYGQASNLLFHVKSIPREQLQQAIIDAALGRTNERIQYDRQVIAMAQRIVFFGEDKIDRERWNRVVNPPNFVWQLRGNNSRTSQSLDALIHANRLRDSFGVNIATFKDIPDLLPGQSIKSREGVKAMFEFYQELSEGLNIRPEKPGEVAQMRGRLHNKLERVNLQVHHKATEKLASFDINPAAQPFKLSFVAGFSPLFEEGRTERATLTSSIVIVAKAQRVSQ